MPIIRQTGGASDDSQHPFNDSESNSSITDNTSSRTILRLNEVSDGGSWISEDIVGINNTTPDYTLDVNGDGRFIGDLRCLSLIQTSQSNKKKLISDITKTTSKKIEFKEYVYKSDSGNRKRYGVLAEEIEADYPELVHIDADGVKGVNYIDLLVKRVSELEKELEDISLIGGLKGEDGVDGVKGDQGSQGVKGDAGSNGLTGAQGIQGEAGVKGDTGAQGEAGLNGGQGITGPKGDKGDAGENGSQGEAGIKGDTGAQGVQGIKGDAGDRGPQGTKGDTGLTGDRGPQGARGSDGNNHLNNISSIYFDEKRNQLVVEINREKYHLILDK
jgi:hypothetical protein|tara:strand:+ start:846 stop:1835 length:990 start_codon:yes stop_codon:yes gene_type:complete